MPRQTPPSPAPSPFDILTRRRATPVNDPSEQPASENEQPDGQPFSQSNGQTDSADAATSSRGGKRSNPRFQKFTVYIPKTTHRAAKVIAGLQGRELSEVVQDLLAVYVREHQADALKSL